MRILLTGATGFIGSHLHRALVTRGHEVIACARGRVSLPGTEVIPCDFSRDQYCETWLPRVAGVDVVINTVGIIRERGKQTFSALHTESPRALFAACESAGVRRVIQISALGADDSAVSRYHLTKRAADDDLARRDLEWVILRPSIVYGPGAKSSALFRAVAALPLVPLVGKGEQLIQPIHVEDLIGAILMALESNAPVGRRIDCVGPHPLTFLQLIAAWRQWLGLGEARVIRLPYRVALAAGRIGGFLGEAPVDREAVAMLQRGNRGETTPFVEHFGFEPRQFSDALRATPATEADRWHARLYFLRPLLRLSLGVMWIWAGLTSAFFYPASESFQMLAAVGITGLFAPVALYGAALLDALLGLALLLRYQVPAVGAIQLAVIGAYTLLISLSLPELWLHPFGPVVKNLPIVAGTLVIMALEARAR